MKRMQWVVPVLAATVLFPATSPANYSYQFHPRENGHLKAWWTKDGQRISSYPFVDDDGIRAGDELYFGAPTKDINDIDTMWRRNTGKTSATVAYTGAGYPMPTFDDYFTAFPGPISWFDLVDAAEATDVQVRVDLLIWGDFLRFHPMPDPAMPFMFDPLGLCPQLPGYQAFDASTLLPFEGIMLVSAVNTLSVAGDVDGDSHVDVVDLLYLVDSFGTIQGDPLYDPCCDFNIDGSVDVVDLLIMVENFGT
jgi:hypothetical protein